MSAPSFDLNAALIALADLAVLNASTEQSGEVGRAVTTLARFIDRQRVAS